jgi:ATPase family associated with various cellular activities (AAA)
MSITLRPSQLYAFLLKCIPAHEPVLISGPPGGGKTSIVEQACAAAKADLIVMHPVVSDPTDFKGMPWVKQDEATFLPFGDLQQLISAKRLTVCFMDDLGQATPAVQAAAMQLILGRHVNGHKVSQHVVFIAATNRRQDRAGVSGILEPVKSRFTSLVELGAHVDDWCQWAASTNIAPEVIAYIRFRPDALSEFKPTADISNSPCQRTWASVSRLLALDLPRDLQIPAFYGAVGEARGGEFVSFLRVWQSMVSPDAVLTAPDTTPIPTEASALCAIALAIATRVKNASMGRFCRYLTRMVDANRGDVAAYSMKAAISRDPTLANSKGYIDAMSGPLGELMIGSN